MGGGECRKWDETRMEGRGKRQNNDKYGTSNDGSVRETPVLHSQTKYDYELKGIRYGN